MPRARSLRQLRADAPRDGRAVRRRLRARRLAPRRRGGFSPAVDVFYERRPAARGRARRAGRHRPRRDRAGDRGPRARHRRPPPPGRRRGPRLPAARDRLRAVPAHDPARRRRRRRPGARPPTATGSCASSCRSSRSRAARADACPIEVGRTRRTRDRDRQRRRGPHATSRWARGRAALPATLPVLPLRETVPLPDTLTPLAVGQERSIAARQRRARRQPDARDGRLARTPSSRRRARTSSTTSASSARSRGCSRCPTGRCGSSSRAPSACASTAGSREQPYLVAEISELPDVVARVARARPRSCATSSTRSAEIVEQVPYLPEELQLAVANLDDPVALSHLIAGALRLQDRGEAGAARGGRRRQAAAPARRASSPRSSRSSRSARRSSPRSSPRSTRASASTSCASSSRRSRRSSASSTSPRPRPRSCASSSPRSTLPEDVRKQVDRELGRLEKLPPAGRRARRHPHLPGVDRLAAVGQGDRGQPRPRARPRGARRGPLRHRAGQGPHPRVPRGAQAQAGRARLDPLLRRPARRRQDLAGPLDRPRARAASSSASAPAACATRPRSAATAAPTSARCPATIIRALRDAGSRQPAVHDRRDRQDGRGLPRRSGQRDARGARPRAERDVPRPLPRRAVRPLRA